MLIITKRKDYYDGVAGTTGIDKTIVYDRQMIEFDDLRKAPKVFHIDKYDSNLVKNNPFYRLGNTDLITEFKKKYPHDSYFIIGFCGKLYLGWKLYSEVKRINYSDSNAKIDIIYSVDDIKKIFKPFAWWGTFSDVVDHVLNYDAMPIFRELNTPCFVYDEDYKRTDVDFDKPWHNKKKKMFVINPLLKEYEFYKVFDTFQAFQEIQMFIGGVLGNREKDIVVVEDKYKIAQHGFDKWSFRKEPQK